MANRKEPSPSLRTGSDVLFKKVLPKMIEKRLNEWIESSSSVNIFVTGKTGTGKSTLVNSLYGSDVSPEGHTLKPMTDKVEVYVTVVGDIVVKVWDSPGLQDGTDKEEEYLEDIKRNCKGEVDLFLYCIDMSSTRFVPGNKDIMAMKKLTEKLGADIWKNALIVLTFANKYILTVEEDYEDNPEGLQAAYAEEVESWKALVSSALKNDVGLDTEMVKSVPIIPAGHYVDPEILPGDGLWLSVAWENVLCATRPQAQPAFVKLNEGRLNAPSPEICLLESQILAKAGRQIGESLGVGEMGMAIGLTKAQEILVSLAEQHGYVYISDDAPVSVDIDSYYKGQTS